MDKNTLISIIVAAYNVSKYLDKCIEPLKAQTYKNIEIIIIDDGSTDDTGDLADKLAESDDRIKVFHIQNSGLSGARNYGTTKASGKYIAFIDADDYAELNMYEELYNAIIKNEAQIAVCKFYMRFSHYTHNFSHNTKEVIKDSNDAENMLFDPSYGDYAWNKLYLKSFFDNIKYPQGIYYEDKFTTYKLYALANKIVFIDKALINYVQRKDSIMHDYTNFKKIKDNIDSCIYRLNDPIFKNKEKATEDFLNFIILSKCRIMTSKTNNKSEHLKKLDDYLEKYFLNNSVDEKTYKRALNAKKFCIIYFPRLILQDIARKILLL